MQDEEELNPDEVEIATLLSRLVPLRPEVNAQEILLEGCTRKGRQEVWLWRGIAAALAAGLALALLLRPPPRSIQKVVYLPPEGGAQPAAAVSHSVAPRDQPQPSPQIVLPSSGAMTGDAPAPRMSGNNYIAVRNRILTFGLRGLPAPRAWAPPRYPLGMPAASSGARESQSVFDQFSPFSQEG